MEMEKLERQHYLSDCLDDYRKWVIHVMQSQQKEIDELKDEDRQIVFECPDEHYIALSEKGLQRIKDSAEEFDGIMGGYVVGNLSEIVKENTTLKKQVEEMRECLEVINTADFHNSAIELQHYQDGKEIEKRIKQLLKH